MLRAATIFKGHHILGATRAYNEANKFLDTTRNTFPTQNNDTNSLILSPCYSVSNSYQTIVLTCWNNKETYTHFLNNRYVPTISDSGLRLFQIETRYYHINPIKKNLPLL